MVTILAKILPLAILSILKGQVDAVPRISPHHIARGGNSGTRFGPVGLRKQGSQKQQFFPIVEDLARDDNENQEVKNIVSAFLSRDDRNTFIGK
jgi:hypothetical protein